MSTSKTPPLQIAAIGLGEKMTNALSLFFKFSCQLACELGPEHSADICLVDLDDFKGKLRLAEQLKTHPQRPVIVLSVQQTSIDGTISLRKPINSTQLFEAVKQAHAQLSGTPAKSIQVPLSEAPAVDTGNAAESSPPSLPEERSSKPGTEVTGQAVQGGAEEGLSSKGDAQTADHSVQKDTSEDRPETYGKTEVQGKKTGKARSEPSTHRAAMSLDERSATTYIGSAPNVDFSDQEQVAKAQYDPDDFLQGYLAGAYAEVASKDENVLIECPTGLVVVRAGTKKVLMTINEHKLRTLSIVPISHGSVSVATNSRVQLSAKDESVLEVDREALMWKVALWAARGRVPLGTSFMIPVEMRCWPNLTKLMVFPHALRIAAMWAKRPYSLMDTAKHLNIPQRNVFAFYSAAHAIGLVSMVESEGVSLIKPVASAAQGRKGILGRIIDRLRRQ